MLAKVAKSDTVASFLLSDAEKRILIFCADDRWLEWLDSKLALLISRDEVDPRDYGGKSYEEYVFVHSLVTFC